ncbi:MAG: energy-coupling factor transporter ATPase [Clostridia bacterium]|nr:energy-coupling factor transporter ATPase [Clostridia bacterium]
MNNIVEIKELIFEYKKDEDGQNVRALSNINLDIEKGSLTVIIGHNGSGKSTLAKNINALLLPSGGKVYVKGLDTADESKLWDIRQTAGMVFQNPDNQLVSAIVEDDIAFGPENLGIDPQKIRERVEDSLNMVEMGEYKKKAPHLLSGGQKQRIAIAGVIAMRPECIVFDEPTAMLDPHGRKEVMETICKLNKDENITIIHITHFMEEAALADRVVVVDHGKIILDGSPKEIFTQVKKLKEIGLEVPMVTELASRLNHKGIPIPKDIITIEEMVNYLCQ